MIRIITKEADYGKENFVSGVFVRFILYKGDHYHLTVSSDWGEDIFVDTNDVWDNGDHVGISIFPESIKITQIVES